MKPVPNPMDVAKRATLRTVAKSLGEGWKVNRDGELMHGGIILVPKWWATEHKVAVWRCYPTGGETLWASGRTPQEAMRKARTALRWEADRLLSRADVVAVIAEQKGNAP